MRLSKFLAECGIASRREAERLILLGKVFVNEEKVTELGTKVNPGVDKITVDGKLITKENKVYYLLNKPKGYTTTVKDKFAKKTVIELIGGNERIYPVGRLDKETSGLLILTNDGDLTNKLTHPKYEKEKEYEVLISTELNKEDLLSLETGVDIDNKKTAPAEVNFVRKHKDNYIYSITIKEGRNRQVRKMFAELGKKVLELKRIRIDFLLLKDLNEGDYRKLTENEIQKLQK